MNGVMPLAAVVMVFGLSAGSVAAALEGHELAAWLSCASAGCVAMAFLGRSIWRASKDHAGIASQFESAATNLNTVVEDLAGLEQRINTKLDDHGKKLDCHDSKLADVRERVSSIEARCGERTSQCQSSIDSLLDAREALDAVTQQVRSVLDRETA